MNITKEIVQNIADLAKLKLSAEEITKYQQELTRILDFMTILNEVDSNEIGRVSEKNKAKNRFREDTPERSLDRTPILKNAPEADSAYFKVSHNSQK